MSNRNEAVKKISDINMSKLKIKIDITTLKMIIRFLFKDTVLKTRKTLRNIDLIMDSLDLSVYETDDNESQILSLIWIIKKILEARFEGGFTTNEMIKKYCLDDPDCDEYKESLINEGIENSANITYSECKYLVNQIDDRVNFGYILNFRDKFFLIMSAIDESDDKSFKTLSNDLYQCAAALQNIKRKSNSLSSDQTFSLLTDEMENVVAEAMDNLKNRNRIFTTGIRRLNTFLAPGFLSKRLYTFLAFPGGGKSQILLKMALDIRTYNTRIETKDPDKRPAILFITMENSIHETVERLWNMTTSDDDIRNYTDAQVIKKMRDKGGLKLTDKNNIDLIIKYYDNRAIDTNDLRGIMQDLQDDGIETVALIVDYVKRLRPAEKAQSEKEELKNITNELKSIATIEDIPVITAQQLNRSAASVVDAAIQNDKENVTMMIGRDGVAGAWEIIENSDMVIIINQERKRDTNELYMTFKLLKRRYRSADTSKKLANLDYFNHPYDPENSLRLIDDVNLDKCLSLTSLSTQFDPADQKGNKHGKKNAMERKEKKKKDTIEEGEYDPYDMDREFY